MLLHAGYPELHSVSQIFQVFTRPAAQWVCFGVRRRQEDFPLLGEPQDMEERIIATTRNNTRWHVSYPIGSTSYAHD